MRNYKHEVRLNVVQSLYTSACVQKENKSANQDKNDDLKYTIKREINNQRNANFEYIFEKKKVILKE